MTATAHSEPLRDVELRAEARWLHQALFGCPPAAVVEAGYVEAHRHFCRADSNSPLLRRIVERRLDAEALELVLRRRQPTLSRKCRILVYLAETRPSLYPRFTEARSRRIAAWPALVWAGARTAFKMAKGWWLVRRHRLA